jgi:predicted dehydrogenase
VEAALSAGYHVVCEKPLTFSRDETLALLARAAEHGRELFSTNTYLFAGYLRAFRRHWLRGRTFTELELTWADAGAETRHGEAKRYDSGVPVIHDVLPHVASIVLATHGPWRFARSSIAVSRGGSAVTVEFAGDDLTLRASLARNAERRVRRLRFAGPAGRIALDFTAEPGVVSGDGRQGVCVDPAWDSRRKPIAQMLESVQAYFAGGALDGRLSADAALLGNELIDAVAEGYVQQQLDFLAGARDQDRAYAAKEAEAIRERGLPHLEPASPLRRLAATSHLELNRSGRVLT